MPAHCNQPECTNFAAFSKYLRREHPFQEFLVGLGSVLVGISIAIFTVFVIEQYRKWRRRKEMEVLPTIHEDSTSKARVNIPQHRVRIHFSNLRADYVMFNKQPEIIVNHTNAMDNDTNAPVNGTPTEIIAGVYAVGFCVAAFAMCGILYYLWHGGQKRAIRAAHTSV
ncbi:hypothetical protein NHQ30_009143 [Ciborinia camelliae]|nr:hypothetical protein NHQ30_009143 [Ciborinia camelliae]